MIETVPQHEFSAALLAPTSSAPAGLKAAQPPDLEHRFAVYRNNVVVSLIGALAETFPVTAALVGEEFFRAMARERVLADPPRSPVLIEYADAFPDFIAAFAPAAGIPYLADVARIEALRVQAYHAKDAEPLAPAVYHELSLHPERLGALRATLHPACRWMCSRYAAYALWLAHQGLDDIAEAEVGEIDLDSAEDILVTRPSLDVLVGRLPRRAVAFLDALRDGKTFVAALASTQSMEVAADPSSLFSILIQYGLVVGLDGLLEH